MLLAPGTILQRMFVEERLSSVAPGFFVEVGVGEGNLSHLLLQMGWRGLGYDFSSESLAGAAVINEAAVREERYQLLRRNWLHDEGKRKADLVIS